MSHIVLLRCRLEHIGRLARMSVLDTEVDGSNPGSRMFFRVFYILYFNIKYINI